MADSGRKPSMLGAIAFAALSERMKDVPWGGNMSLDVVACDLITVALLIAAGGRRITQNDGAAGTEAIGEALQRAIGVYVESLKAQGYLEQFGEDASRFLETALDDIRQKTGAKFSEVVDLGELKAAKAN